MIPVSGSIGPAIARPIPATAWSLHHSRASRMTLSPLASSSSVVRDRLLATRSSQWTVPFRSTTFTRFHVPPQSTAMTNSRP